GPTAVAPPADEQIIEDAAKDTARGPTQKRQGREQPHHFVVQTLVVLQEFLEPIHVKLILECAGEYVHENHRQAEKRSWRQQQGRTMALGGWRRTRFNEVRFGSIRPGMLAWAVAYKEPKADAKRHSRDADSYQRRLPRERQLTH